MSGSDGKSVVLDDRDTEPKTPMWLPAVGALLFLMAGLAWAMSTPASTDSAAGSAGSAPSASAAPAAPTTAVAPARGAAPGGHGHPH